MSHLKIKIKVKEVKNIIFEGRGEMGSLGKERASNPKVDFTLPVLLESVFLLSFWGLDRVIVDILQVCKCKKAYVLWASIFFFVSLGPQYNLQTNIMC